jgi:hypothetical protein
MTVSTLLSRLAVVSVAFEAPVAAALFGAAALFWSTPPARFQMVGLKEAAAAKLTAGVCSLVPRLPTVAPSEPWQSQWIRLPLSTCHRHAGLRVNRRGVPMPIGELSY